MANGGSDRTEVRRTGPPEEFETDVTGIAFAVPIEGRADQVWAREFKKAVEAQMRKRVHLDGRDQFLESLGVRGRRIEFIIGPESARVLGQFLDSIERAVPAANEAVATERERQRAAAEEFRRQSEESREQIDHSVREWTERNPVE